MGNLFSQELAECVGLWLAEGDRKTKSEITFTNNCTDLIDLFYKILINLFRDKKESIRIYIYSNRNNKINQYKDIITKSYIDKRARKPYYILRLASVEYVKKWKEIVEDISKNEKLYPLILKGFFAGEGNIKEGSHNSRVLRIAQKQRLILLEKILKIINIKKFIFRSNDRSYYIYGKPNWDIFAELELADLHPEKKERFWRVYNEFKQDHYKNNYLINNIFLDLETPKTTRELMKRYNRSFARIQDILITLKKLGKIKNFRVGSLDYWTNNLELIIISKIKNKYQNYLNQPKKTSDLAKKFKVGQKCSLKILRRLQVLNLIDRNKDKMWSKMSINEGNLLIK